MEKIFVEDNDYKIDENDATMLLYKYGMMKILRDNEEIQVVFVQENDYSAVYRITKQDSKYYYCEFIHWIG